ncbi:MAG: hypothetical protein AB7T86_05015 [Xanthobacteraceae bacterium]
MIARDFKTKIKSEPSLRIVRLALIACALVAASAICLGSIAAVANDGTMAGKRDQHIAKTSNHGGFHRKSDYYMPPKVNYGSDGAAAGKALQKPPIAGGSDAYRGSVGGTDAQRKRVGASDAYTQRARSSDASAGSVGGSDSHRSSGTSDWYRQGKGTNDKQRAKGGADSYR